MDKDFLLKNGWKEIGEHSEADSLIVSPEERTFTEWLEIILAEFKGKPISEELLQEIKWRIMENLLYVVDENGNFEKIIFKKPVPFDSNMDSVVLSLNNKQEFKG